MATQYGVAKLPRCARAQSEVLLGVHDNRASFGSFVGEAGQLRGVGQMFGAESRRRAG